MDIREGYYAIEVTDTSEDMGITYLRWFPSFLDAYEYVDKDLFVKNPRIVLDRIEYKGKDR